MNNLQRNYINARRTLDTITKEGVAAYDSVAQERLALAKELHDKARRALILWGLDKCLALCQTDLDREAFQCLRTYAGRGLTTSQAKRLAEMCLKLED